MLFVCHNLTILENAGSENGFSVSSFCFQSGVAVNAAGLEMRIDSLFSGSWLGKQVLSLGEKGLISCLDFVNAKFSLKQSGTTEAAPFCTRAAEGGAGGWQEGVGLPFLSLPSLKAKTLNELGTTHQQSSFGKAEFVFALRQSAYPGSSAGFVKPFCPKTVVEEAEHITYT